MTGAFRPAQAPFIRPGVVIHEQGANADQLLARFAQAIKDRGFTVAGCVRDEGRLYDIGAARHAEAGEDEDKFVAAILRAAMRDDADLVVISGLSAFVAAATGLRARIDASTSLAMPVLTALPGAEIQKWLDFAGHGGSMVSPSLSSLWQWWGADHLYRDLALGVAEDAVRQIVCGPRWLMIQGPAGTGLSYLPKSPREFSRRLQDLKRLSLRQLAELSASWDPLDMAVAVAAINAHYNRIDIEGGLGNGANAFGDEAGRVVVVGAFPGLAETLKNPQVIETDPRPGEYPTVAMDTLLPGCAAAVAASSSLVNRSLPRILGLAGSSRVALVGPSTPMARRLHDYGCEILGGLVIRDPVGLGNAIKAGAMPREFQNYGQYMHIRASTPQTVKPRSRIGA